MPKGIYVRTHVVPKKVYPTEMVAEVERLYHGEGVTQQEIADQLGTTLRVIYRLMVNHSIPRRVAAKRNQAGAANHMWRGDEAGYQALHLRVAVERGKPSLCAWCGQDEGRFEWANVSGNYADLNDYERLCASCHRLYDASRRRLTGRSTMPTPGGGAR